MFIGREREISDLNGFWGRDHGVLMTGRGRRRIGKSTLIAEFASRTAKNFISIVGLAPRKGMTDARQRRNFCEKIAEYAEREYIGAETWSKAFRKLDGLLVEPQPGGDASAERPEVEKTVSVRPDEDAREVQHIKSGTAQLQGL